MRGAHRIFDNDVAALRAKCDFTALLGISRRAGWSRASVEKRMSLAAIVIEL
jgi:hypothetical protein